MWSQSVGIKCLNGISYPKAAYDVAMLERKLTLVHMDFVTLNLYIEFHTGLWAFDKQLFFILAFLNLRRPVRCLYFPFAKTMFGLDFSARGTGFRSAMQVHLTYCVARARFDAITKRETT